MNHTEALDIIRRIRADLNDVADMARGNDPSVEHHVHVGYGVTCDLLLLMHGRQLCETPPKALTFSEQYLALHPLPR